MDAFWIALSGINTAAAGLATSANNVANINSIDYKALRMDQEDLAQGGTCPSSFTKCQDPAMLDGSNVDLTEEMLDQMRQSTAYSADLKVIQARDDQLGMTLDMYCE